jgi:phenylacetate-CoA ligase
MRTRNLHPENVTSLADVRLFPILDKQKLKSNYDEFIPSNLDSIRGVKTSQTGGTTGGILLLRTDSITRSSAWGTFGRFCDWMGISEGDRKLLLMGGHVFRGQYMDRVRKAVKDWITNSRSFSPYDTSEENLARIFGALSKENFSLIRSYPQFLFSLARRLDADAKRFNIEAITTTAEPLMVEHRRLFEKVFGSEVFDQYGCGEIMGIAYECPTHEGLHIADERVLVEFNENDEIIVTDLDNFAMPLIRYWNADQVELSPDACSCGRKSRLIKRILGRTCDYIIGVNGEFLHWAYFWHLFFDSRLGEENGLEKFQVIQTAEDRLKIRVVCEVIALEKRRVLIENIQERLGNMNVEFVFEDDIENASSGKYRPVINELL